MNNRCTVPILKALIAAAVATLMIAHAGVASAQGKAGEPSGEVSITVSVPEGGEHLVRFLPSSDAKGPQPLPVSFDNRIVKVTCKPAELGAKARIAVDNVRAGISAIRPLSGAGGPRNGVLDLKAADFDHVRQLNVTVMYEGKPVSVAKVTLEPREGKPITQVLDPAKKGVAAFEDVPMGRARVTVEYGEGFRQTQDVEVVGGQAPGPLEINVAVANRVPTVEQTSPSTESGAGEVRSPREPAGAASSTPVAPKGGGGGLTGWLGTILGLAIGAGVIYLLYRWAMSGGMAATLKKAGIEVSGPVAEPASTTPWQPAAPQQPVVADPSLCPFCGQKKDAAGNCACSTVPGAGVAAPTVTAPVQPRLVGTAGVYAGSIFPIEGSVSIGREPTNAIALTSDTTVSRRHASLRVEGGNVMVADEGSSNGTFVNGVRIQGPQPLRPGDEIQIGNTRFRFEA
jgi:hypothetical protein